MLRVSTFSLILCVSSLGLTACKTTELEKSRSLEVETDASWLRTELYFAIGLLPRDGGAANEKLEEGEAMWENFLDETVTPLFPDGLTVFDAVGQWLSDRFEKPPHLATKVLAILHPDTPEANEKIEAIRAKFLELTGQQSVLRVSNPADVSF